MKSAWRVADVRAAEAALIATLPPGTLMQRAAAGLARRCALLLAERSGAARVGRGGAGIFAGRAGTRVERGGVYGSAVLLLVGSGDNGGDALYAGALLAGRGAAVRALLLDPERAHRGGLAALRAAGGRIRDLGPDAPRPAEASRTGARIVDSLPARVDLVIDGIVGIGGSGGLRAAASRVVAALAGLRDRSGGRPPVVAVDVPSGVEVDTGDVPGAPTDKRSAGPSAVTADVTVTFGCLKPALVVGPAAPLAGQVELVDIGLGPWLRATPALSVPEWSDVDGWWPRLDADTEKYRRGVVGVATGSASYPGAAVLSVGGALAGPAGMVRYAGGARAEVLREHPSVVATERVAEAGRVQAWVCGSGLGTGEAALTELRCVLAAPVPVILDADALTLLVDGSSADRLRQRDAPIVMTPHDREFARLAGEPPGADRVGAALRLASWTNAVVLLKGDRTIIATPDGRAYANPTGTPALATGGTGDVLAGLLGSLLAGGLPADRAAVLAAYLHGLAGREAAGHGPVTAADVVAGLRPVIARLS